MNIELLNRTFEIDDNPGLDTLDPRLSDITTFVQDGDFDKAAAQAESIIQENIYDIRIIGYFYYGIFLDEGLSSLGTIYQSISGVLDTNWEAIGPVKNRVKITQTSLNWILKQLLKKLQREEETKGASWKRWVDEVTVETLEEALEASENLHQAMGATLEDEAGPVLDVLSKVEEWLRAFEKVVYREPEPEEEVEEEDTTTINAPLVADTIGVKGSYHLEVLLKKISAFERLIKEENFAKASLIADDINNLIENFDPKLYFPKLFAGFSMMYAANIGQFAVFEEQKETAEWKAMQEYYKVDIDGFMSF